MLFFAEVCLHLSGNFLKMLKLIKTVKTALKPVADKNIIENYLALNCFLWQRTGTVERLFYLGNVVVVVYI